MSTLTDWKRSHWYLFIAFDFHSSLRPRFSSSSHLFVLFFLFFNISIPISPFITSFHFPLTPPLFPHLHHSLFFFLFLLSFSTWCLVQAPLAPSVAVRVITHSDSPVLAQAHSLQLEEEGRRAPPSGQGGRRIPAL